MEYIEGGTFHELIDKKETPLRQIAVIIQKVAQGVYERKKSVQSVKIMLSSMRDIYIRLLGKIYFQKNTEFNQALELIFDEMERVEILDPILKSGKDEESILWIYSDVYGRSKSKIKSDKGIEACTKMLQSASNMLSISKILIRRGSIYLEKRKVQKSLEDFQRIIEINPKSTEVYQKMGIAYHMLKQYNKAEEAFSMCAKLNPNWIWAYLSRAEFYYKRKRYQLSEKDYLKTIDISPNLVLPYVGISNVYIETNRHQDALTMLSKAIKLHPYEHIYVKRGYIYMHMKRYKEALADFNKLVEIVPELEIGYYNKGVYYLDFKQYQKAIAQFSIAIKKNPRSSRSFLNRGLAYQHTQRYKEAIEDFGNAIKVLPSFKMAYRNRGLLYRKLKMYEKAVADFGKTIEITPSDVQAYIDRGVTFTLQNQYRLAELDFTKAIKIKPGFIPYHNRGRVYLVQKQGKKAIADLAIAMKLASEIYHKSHTLYQLASSYALLKNTQKALFCLKKSLELGFRDFNMLYRDNNFFYLRNHPAFRNLIAK